MFALITSHHPETLPPRCVKLMIVFWYKKFFESSFGQPMNTETAFPDFDPVENQAPQGGKPRRPPNAYILYCLEKRTELRAQHPELPNVDISKLLGDKWKSLDESERRPYKERAKVLQSEFKEQNPDYKYEKARMKRSSQELLRQQNRQLGLEEAALRLMRLAASVGFRTVPEVPQHQCQPQSPQELNPLFAGDYGQFIDSAFDH